LPFQVVFLDRVSHFCPGWFGPQSSYIGLLYKWYQRHMPPHATYLLRWGLTNFLPQTLMFPVYASRVAVWDTILTKGYLLTSLFKWFYYHIIVQGYIVAFTYVFKILYLSWSYPLYCFPSSLLLPFLEQLGGFIFLFSYMETKYIRHI
jgi:hypothetical protein